MRMKPKRLKPFDKRRVSCNPGARAIAGVMHARYTCLRDALHHAAPVPAVTIRRSATLCRWAECGLRSFTETARTASRLAKQIHVHEQTVEEHIYLSSTHAPTSSCA